MTQTISAADFKNILAADGNIELIDVRTPAEFREVHVGVARSEPLDRLDPQAIQSSRNGTANEPLYIICRSGARGRQACDKFVAAGVKNVINVEGGTMACAAAGVPVVRGQTSSPLHCQVQIITGLLVAIGSILAAWVNPVWIWLPIAMGAGLAFSGLTNTCVMGTCLTRMPWNQCRDRQSL